MKLSMDDILLMNALEKVTGVNAKDCLVDGQLVSFLVPADLVGKAIGKAAVNVKSLEQQLKKRIEIVAYSDKPEEVFAKALEVNYVTARKTNDKIIVLLDPASKAKAYKNNSRIKRVRELIQRNFGLELVIN
ncbi:NusA-like KH domain protein [uncultured archaeon]|nr:NusA-like KH domain protein [uncultured archaeon]